MTSTIRTHIRTLTAAALLSAAALSLLTGAAHAADDSLSPEQRAAGCTVVENASGTTQHYEVGDRVIVWENGAGYPYRCKAGGKLEKDGDKPLPVGAAPSGRWVARLPGGGVLSLR
jgi:hypothetical protein